MCREFNYDVSRYIRKFDIYVCDLGDIPADSSDLTLAKSRPCIILSSDDINSPISNAYMVAGIRTEHGISINNMNDAEYVVQEKRKLGRIYVPILMAEGYKFIDITQTRMIPSNKVNKYIGSINNDETKNRINYSIMELFFSKAELGIGIKEEKIDVIDADTVTKKETIETPSSILLLNEVNDDNEIGQKINAALSKQEKEKENMVIEMHKKVKRKEITKYKAAKELGLTIKDYDAIIKEINKEKKGKSKYTERKLPKTLPQGFSVYYKAYIEGKMTVKDIAERLGKKSTQTIYNYIDSYKLMQEQLQK
jgi:hypothetical protein